MRFCTLITSYPSGKGIQVLQIVCIDARLQLDGYIVSPSTCMKQGIGNDFPEVFHIITNENFFIFTFYNDAGKTYNRATLR